MLLLPGLVACQPAAPETTAARGAAVDSGRAAGALATVAEPATAPSAATPAAYPYTLPPVNEAGRAAAGCSFSGYAEAGQLYCRADLTLTIELKNGQYHITSVIPYD